MDKLQSFRVYLNERLMEVAVEIFGAFEKMSVEYQEENNRLRSILRISPEIQLGRIDSLQVSLSVPEEQVPPEQQFCEQVWVPNLGQEFREPTQIKEEQEELRTSQEEEQNQGLFDTKDSILTPFCVKRECEQEGGDDKAMLREPQNVNRLKMSKELSFRVFLNKCLTESAAVKIFGTVEKTVSEYQEENDQLRRMIQTFPEIKLARIDSLQFSLSKEEVPPEQQHCEQEWSPSLWQEDPEATQIKEKQEELRNSQEGEQDQGLFDTKDSILTPCVKKECDHKDPFHSMTLPQTQTVENRGSDSRSVDLQPFSSVTHLRGLAIPSEPPDHLNVSSHSPAISSDQEDLDTCLPLDQHPPMREHYLKLSNMSAKAHYCRDCGESFILKADLQRHVTLTKKRPSECNFCRKRYNSTCKLKAHVRLCHSEKSSICHFCCKIFKCKASLSIHIRVHTGEKPFSCGDCGKTFRQKGHLTVHKRMHTGEKPYSCDDCGRSFSQQGCLAVHKQMHTGEKRFRCDECGKSFCHNWRLTSHKTIHTGEKQFYCGDCGKSFSLKKYLKSHKLIHTGEKPFSCDDCGKSFCFKGNLNIHKRIHTGEKPFVCGDCGKRFNRKEVLTMHILTHTGEKQG